MHAETQNTILKVWVELIPMGDVGQCIYLYELSVCVLTKKNIHAKLWYEVLISFQATARDDGNNDNKVLNNYWYGPEEKLH